ncbi:hypothetical protein T01_15 [Trichinella spiralis]|uniref:Uncharacterized protein n=1 Tax=Trichinella spiralis TaxID=6334 RepID=A0A0V1AZ19_TRISP|nr:hypothetical protein T01_15 [Trichinella spiralis]
MIKFAQEMNNDNTCVSRREEGKKLTVMSDEAVFVLGFLFAPYLPTSSVWTHGWRILLNN